MRFLLAERIGWTLEYIDSMDDKDYLGMLYVIDGLDTARAHEQSRASERR